MRPRDRAGGRPCGPTVHRASLIDAAGFVARYTVDRSHGGTAVIVTTLRPRRGRGVGAASERSRGSPRRAGGAGACSRCRPRQGSWTCASRSPRSARASGLLVRSLERERPSLERMCRGTGRTGRRSIREALGRAEVGIPEAADLAMASRELVDVPPAGGVGGDGVVHAVDGHGVRTRRSRPRGRSRACSIFAVSGWLLLPVVPAVSMRLLSEEFRSGTIEPLLTSPVSDAAVVMGNT